MLRKAGPAPAWRIGLLTVLIAGSLLAPLRLFDDGQPTLKSNAALAEGGNSGGGDGDGGDGGGGDGGDGDGGDGDGGDGDGGDGDGGDGDGGDGDGGDGDGGDGDGGDGDGGDGDGGGGDGGDGDGGDGDGGDGGDDGGDDDGGDDDGGGDDGGDDGGGHDSDDDSDGDGDDNGDDDSDSDDTGTGALGTAGRGSRGGDHYRADEVVVLNEDAAFFASVRQLGFVILEQQPLGALGLTITRLRLPRNLTLDRGLALLRRTFPGSLVDVNAIYRPEAALSLPAPGYARALIGWGAAPEDCGHGIRLGMIDTGVAASLPDFDGRRIDRRSFVADSADPAPMEHGTAIAALLVGRAAAAGQGGLLPAATLYSAEIFAEGPDGTPTASVVGVAAALDWLVAGNVPVVNISLSGDANLLMQVAVARAVDRGTILVAAAGNGGPDAEAGYPAAYGDVLAVTAVDSRLRPYDAANRGDYIDLAAPGVRIWTVMQAGGSYNTGTSFAAPFVSAAVAAQLGAGADRGLDQVRERLSRTALDLGAPGKDSVFGWGLLQAGKPCQQTAAEIHGE